MAATSTRRPAGLGLVGPRLIEKIDAEIAGPWKYALPDARLRDDRVFDRAEAGAPRPVRRLEGGGPSPAATNPRARRGFLQGSGRGAWALVEAEAAARLESVPALPTAPEPAGSDARMGSSRENAPPPVRERFQANPDRTSAELIDARLADGKPLVNVPPVKKPG